jgi:hypothetical protein
MSFAAEPVTLVTSIASLVTFFLHPNLRGNQAAFTEAQHSVGNAA